MWTCKPCNDMENNYRFYGFKRWQDYLKTDQFEYMMRAVALLMEVDQKFRISIIDKF